MSRITYFRDEWDGGKGAFNNAVTLMTQTWLTVKQITDGEDKFTCVANNKC
jgi:hypothetical protein